MGPPLDIFIYILFLYSIFIKVIIRKWKTKFAKFEKHKVPDLRICLSKKTQDASNFLSYGGRITLIKAVLSAMHLHYMQAFKIPVGVIRHIDKMRRNFMWKGTEIYKGINCLVNWERVCNLQENGGLGIIDLNCQNDALLIKWLWADRKSVV